MRLKVIVNPAAGRGRAQKRVASALEIFRHGGATIDLAESRSAEHLAELGRAASVAGYDCVVICGGDGSVHHAVREFDLQRGTLGIIPLGSGDDFARTLGIPIDPAGAAAAVLRRRTRRVDIGTANETRFLVAASVGFDAAVARYASTVSHFRGPTIYLYAVLKMLRHFEPLPVSLGGDGTHGGEMMFAVFANAFRYGGGIRIAPAALIDDGLLDVFVVSACSKLDLLTTLPLAYVGKHTWRRFVRGWRGQTFTVESETPLEVFADGEHVGFTPLRVGIEPAALQVVF